MHRTALLALLLLTGCADAGRVLSAAADSINEAAAQANAGPLVYGLGRIDGQRASVTPLFIWSHAGGFVTADGSGATWTAFYERLAPVGGGFNVYGDGVRAAAGVVTEVSGGIPPGDGCFGIPDAALRLMSSPPASFAPRHVSATRSENPLRMWGSTATSAGVTTFDRMTSTHAGAGWQRIAGAYESPVGAFFDGVTVIAGSVVSTRPGDQALGSSSRLLVYEVQGDTQNVVLDLSGEGEGYTPLEFVDLTYDGVPELIVDRQIGDEYGEVVVYQRTATAWEERIVIPVFGC